MGKHVGGKLVLAGAVAAGAAVWAIKPRSFSDKQRHFVPSVPDVWYAHRGLHDAGSGLTPEYAAHSGEYVALARRCALRAGYGTADFSGSIAPENSLAAFAAACEAGFGIELDVQLTKDGRVVVVHDDNLLRVAGDPRKIADLTYEELSRIPLFPAPAKPGDAEAAPVADPVAAAQFAPQSYYQHVPLFVDVLRVIAGRVPVIVEYKFTDNAAWGERADELMEKGDQLLQAYDGPYVIVPSGRGQLVQGAPSGGVPRPVGRAGVAHRYRGQGVAGRAVGVRLDLPSGLRGVRLAWRPLSAAAGRTLDGRGTGVVDGSQRGRTRRMRPVFRPPHLRVVRSG